MLKTVQNSANVLANATAKTFKAYTLDELVAHRKIVTKNLFETLAIYPNQGVGFKVWRNNWPDGKYVIIKQAKYKGFRTGGFYGVEYFKDQPVQDQPVKIRSCNKRGIWRYDCNGTTALTENGLHYTADVIKQVQLQRQRPDVAEQQQQQ